MFDVEDYYDPDLFEGEEDPSYSQNSGETATSPPAQATVLRNDTISNPLNIARNVSYSIELLYQQMKNNEIDPNPDYQRGKYQPSLLDGTLIHDSA
ncbi:hypothetical protein V5O48_009448 [Marasmius crinis-equi]|uniref:Uncharacterized protein n=1 Tax=Marasmius crinis-equi TaxID=585013 RepID=A0ABR3FB31_9AGAR